MTADNDILKASFSLSLSNTNNKAEEIIITPQFTQTLNVGYPVKNNPKKIFVHNNNKLIVNINRLIMHYYYVLVLVGVFE